MLSNGFDHRPRKRSRLRDGQLGKDADPVELWWAASSSQALLANAVPSIPCASGSVPGFSSGKKKKTKRREVPPNPKSLLSLMSDNIKTVKRVRRAHAKLSVLASSADDANPDGTDDQPSGPRSGGPTTMLSGQALEAEDADAVDDRPWLPHGVSPHSRRTRHVNQVEGEDCLRWMSGRVIEHAGFQGTSKLVLDVLGNVVGEYLQNVGRTMRFMVDKYSRTMTPEVRG
jgi:transcriptional activator SPT7